MFTVTSTNFDFHTPVEAPTFAEAMKIAKSRGFEATIHHVSYGDASNKCVDEVRRVRVAHWSPLYGSAVVGMKCHPEIVAFLDGRSTR